MAIWACRQLPTCNILHALSTTTGLELCNHRTSVEWSHLFVKRTAHIVGQLLEAQRLIQAVVRRLVYSNDDSSLLQPVHHAAGHRRAARFALGGPQRHNVMRGEAVLRQRLQILARRSALWCAKCPLFAACCEVPTSVANSNSRGPVKNEGVKSVHRSVVLYLVADQREQCAA